MIRLTATCPAWKLATVKTILSICDVAGNDHAAECIQNRIKDQFNEFWGIYISSTMVNSGMTSWYVECATDMIFGTYARYINLWRTY